MTRLHLIVAAAAGFLLSAAASPASAQDWPTKPVHILVGFGAGGGTDVATRILADGLSEALGQQFTVENRPGAGGTIAGGIAAKAPKDGYTILSISMGHSVSAVTVKQVPYDPIADFAPVGIFTNSAFVVVVPRNSPVTDIKSLVEFVNKQPGKLNYSTVGLGSTQHLIAEHFRQSASINAQAVSYRTTGEVVSALLRGDAAFAVELYHPIRGQVDSGDLRVIAVATPERWPAIPSVPTLAESGVTGDKVSGVVWTGISGGDATADHRQASQGDAAGASQGCVKSGLKTLARPPIFLLQRNSAKFILSDIKGFQEVAKTAGLEAK